MWPFNLARRVDVIQHWFTLVENFQTSPKEFYGMIEKELQERKVPGLEISHVMFSEGGLLSANREYLRMTRERLVFDICAAPFGRSFFFSCRFAEIPLRINPIHVLILLIAIFILFALTQKIFSFFIGMVVFFGLLAFGIWLMRSAVALGLKDLDATLVKSPLIGPIYERFFRVETYYRTDTRLMYLETVPPLVKKIVEDLTMANGIKLLKQFQTNGGLGEIYQPSVTRLDQGGAKPLPMMVVSMTPFSNSPRTGE